MTPNKADPVPEARVRLAVSGAPGGKVVSATTDRSGAFTLHGLRPGSEYTVIAESDGNRGVETGRVDARTSDTDVRISLGAQDEPAAVHASTPVRVDRVSDREPVDEPEAGSVSPAHDDPPAARRRRPSTTVNEEDLPPAPEAEAMAPAGSASSRASVSTRRSTSQSDAWRSGKRDRVEPGESDGEPSRPNRRSHPIRLSGPAEPEVAPVDHAAKGTGAPVGGPAALPDDGENPLPPALEPVPEKAASAGPEPEPDPPVGSSPRLAAGAPDPDLARLYEGSTTTRQPAASSAFESPTSPTGVKTVSPPEDAAPGALVVVPETFGPVVVHPSDPFAGTRPAAAEPTPARSEPRTRPSLFGSSKPVHAIPASRRPPCLATPSRSTVAVEACHVLPARAADGEKGRPTWGQVVAAVSPPEDPAVTEVADRKPIDPSTNQGATRQGPRRRPARRTGSRSLKAIKVSNTRPECEYDDRLRRIIDFRLPDLDGKPVRFQEIDSDLVLIDFWGTWCPPCLRSIPHLVDLQERMGKRLTVVGIACEADAPQASSAKVTETVRSLKVNYPVLLSRNDGSCPLQEALHIQAFPTMILVDRQGRVLWRDQGATPATLARLDRIISSTPKADETRRY